MHSDTENRPIEFPVSHLMLNLDQSVAFRATTLLVIGWRSVHNFLLMRNNPSRFIYKFPHLENYNLKTVKKDNFVSCFIGYFTLFSKMGEFRI